MRAGPEGVGENDVRLALAEGWRIDAWLALKETVEGVTAFRSPPAGNC